MVISNISVFIENDKIKVQLEQLEATPSPNLVSSLQPLSIYFKLINLSYKNISEILKSTAVPVNFFSEENVELSGGQFSYELPDNGRFFLDFIDALISRTFTTKLLLNAPSFCKLYIDETKQKSSRFVSKENVYDYLDSFDPHLSWQLFFDKIIELFYEKTNEYFYPEIHAACKAFLAWRKKNPDINLENTFDLRNKVNFIAPPKGVELVTNPSIPLPERLEIIRNLIRKNEPVSYLIEQQVLFSKIRLIEKFLPGSIPIDDKNESGDFLIYFLAAPLHIDSDNNIKIKCNDNLDMFTYFDEMDTHFFKSLIKKIFKKFDLDCTLTMEEWNVGEDIYAKPKEIVFTAEASKKIIELGLHLNSDYYKKLLAYSHTLLQVSRDAKRNQDDPSLMKTLPSDMLKEMLKFTIFNNHSTIENDCQEMIRPMFGRK